MEFRLTKFNPKITDEELIADMKKTAKLLGSRVLKRRDYDRHGKYSSSAFRNHFGSWTNAVKRAGLKPSRGFRITKQELFDNLMRVWLKLKRQPTCMEMNSDISQYGWHSYKDKFGSFRAALVKFVEEVNLKGSQKPFSGFRIENLNKGRKKKSNREVNYKMRYRVLTRDDYTCVKCGRSPATEKGVVLQIDHIKPYSKGGETVLSNLQTLCRECNIGKGVMSNVKT